VNGDPTPERAPREAGKLIRCIVPDDGTDVRLLHALHDHFGIVRAETAPHRGVALGSAKSKRGKLPESTMVRVVTVICDAGEADAVFEFMFVAAHLDKPNRGLMWQAPLIGTTSFELSADPIRHA
jgi:hypothetical protein